MTTKIREAPAKTFAGLAVKARALRYEIHLSTQRHPEDDQDSCGFVTNQFVGEIERLAANAALLELARA